MDNTHQSNVKVVKMKRPPAKRLSSSAISLPVAITAMQSGNLELFYDKYFFNFNANSHDIYLKVTEAL